MSFDEKKKYGSMDKAFQAGLAKDEAEAGLAKDIQNSINESFGEKVSKLTDGNELINKRREFLSKNNYLEMSDADFKLLKQDLEMTMLKLNWLQGKYRKQVGKDFVLPIRG